MPHCAPSTHPPTNSDAVDGGVFRHSRSVSTKSPNTCLPPRTHLKYNYTRQLEITDPCIPSPGKRQAPLLDWAND
jgi:hypothetical protein